MSNHTITNRNPQEVVVAPGTAGGAVVQHAQAQLAQLRALTRLGLVEYDLTEFQVRAYLALPGRSPGHQRRMQDLGGHMMGGYDVAFDRVMSDARQDVINDRPEVIVETVTKYVDPPRKSLSQRLFGG